MISALAAFLYSHLWLAVFAAVIIIPSLSHDRERDRQIREQNEKRQRAYSKKWGTSRHGA
jgi:hypothetical protein